MARKMRDVALADRDLDLAIPTARIFRTKRRFWSRESEGTAAMIKDIVVNLKVGAKNNSASDYAISVASTLDAHLTGIVFLYGPTMPVSRAGYVPPELEVIEQHNEAAVEAARQSFTAASARAGIKAAPLTLSAALRSSGDQFGQIARRFDLAIIGQAEPQANSVEENIVEAALFDSGGPVIIVPYIQKAALKLDHVMVCWLW
jgi:hypothetical protein